MYRELQNDIIDIISFFREQFNYFNLRTLLKIYEKKNHFAIFKSHRMYIEFKINDIKTKARFKF